MADQWGRPTFADFMAISNQWNQSQQQAHLREQRAKTQEYGRRLTAGEIIDPKEDGYSFDAHMNAASAIATTRKDNAEADKIIREQKQAQLNDLITAGEQKLKGGDTAGFWDDMGKAYQFMPDGNKIVGFSKDYSKMVIEAPTGQRAYRDTPDPQQALSMAKAFSTKFQETDQKFTEWRRTKNAELLSKPDVWVDSQGRAANHYTMIGKGGEIIETLIDPQTGELLGGFDPNTEQFVKPQSDFTPWQGRKQIMDIKRQPMQEKKDAAELEGIQARTDASRAQAEKARTEATGAKPADKAKQYKADLEVMLKPFAGSKATYDDQGNLTDEGKTALDAAQRLAGKYQRKEQLTPDEQAKVQHALRAWDIYQKMSQDVYGRYQNNTGASWKDVDKK